MNTDNAHNLNSISVELSDIISGHYDENQQSKTFLTTSCPGSASGDTSSRKQLSLVVPSSSSSTSTDSGAILRNLNSSTAGSGSNKKPLLDLPHTDILGPSDVVKQLLTLPYTQGNDYFALHRLGNTLILDSMTSVDGENDVKINRDDNNQPKIGMRKNLSDTIDSSSSPYSSTVVENQYLLDKLHHLENLNIDSQSVNDRIQNSSSSAMSNLHSSSSSNLGSPFLPPPEYFLPQESQSHSQPFRQVLRWQLSDITFATGSNLVVYSTPEHPSLTLGPLDTSKSVHNIRMTCLDYYLDNMMAAVPELALCLHSKGFLRGVTVCPTERIPTLRLGDPHLGLGDQHAPTAQPSHAAQRQQGGPSSTSSDLLFDPQVVEFNALAILRFLQQTCTKENGTYVLHRSGGAREGSPDRSFTPSNSIHVYDLDALTTSSQKKWKWLLAMVSHRFALRLGHHHSLSNPVSKEIIADRQMSLLKTCYDLLLECRELEKMTTGVWREVDEGQGEEQDKSTGTGTIRAAVLEQMADIHLKKAQSSRKGLLIKSTATDNVHLNAISSRNKTSESSNSTTISQNDKLSKNQKKKINKRKKLQDTNVRNSSEESLYDNLGLKTSTAAAESSVTSSQQFHDLTKDIQVLQPDSSVASRHGRGASENVTSSRDKSFSVDQEEEETSVESLHVDYLEEIHLSLDMLKKAMDCVLEDLEEVLGKKDASNPRSDKYDGSDEELPPIIIGNMSCSPVTGGPDPIFEDNSLTRPVTVATHHSSTAMSNRSSSLFASELEELSSNYTLQLSLAMQFTGLLHKVMLACHAVVVEKLDVIPESSRRKRSVSFSQSSGIASSWSGRSSSTLRGNGHDGDGGSSGDCVSTNFSRVSECVSVLSVLLPYCLHWLKLTNSLKLERSKRDSSFKKCDEQGSGLDDARVGSLFSCDLDASEEEDLQDVWSMDRTMLNDLPLLWDIIGTLCRSTSTATSLAKTLQEGEQILLTWREECEVGIKSLVQVMFAINILSSRRMGMLDLNDMFQAELINPAPGGNTLQAAISHVRYLEALQGLDLFHSSPAAVRSVWQTLCGCKDVSESEVDCPANSAPVFTSTMLPLYAAFLSSVFIRKQVGEADIPETLFKVSETISKKNCSTDDILIILKVQGFCFLMATLLITRWQSGWGQDQWSDSSLHALSQTPHSGNANANTAAKLSADKLFSPFTTRKIKYFLSLSIANSSNESPKIIQFVRHLADACNEIGQAIAGRIEDNHAPPSTFRASADVDVTATDISTLLGAAFEDFQKYIVDPSVEAEIYYASAIGLFESISVHSKNKDSSGHQNFLALGQHEARNVITAECNLSSLKRLLAIRISERINEIFRPLLASASSANYITGPSTNSDELKNFDYLQLLSVFTRAVLGRSQSYSYSISATSSSSKKSKKNHQHISANSCTLFFKGDSQENIFLYRYEPLEYVQQGLNICNLLQTKVESLLGVSVDVAISGAQARDGSSLLKDPSLKMVSNEMAHHFFLKGMLFKQCIQHLTSTADAASKDLCRGDGVVESRLVAALTSRDEYIKSAISFFQQAKNIFESLHMLRQKESSNYQLGSLFVLLWNRYMEEYSQLSASSTSSTSSNQTITYSLLGPGEASSLTIKGKIEKLQNAAMDTLDKAMSCYSTAHEYYLKYDVNPTLVRILTDMCDIYLKSYADCESAVIAEMNAIHDLIKSSAHSGNSIQHSASLLPQSTNESITSLLGGALKVIIDCRFALTEAVVSKYRGEMLSLSAKVVSHLLQLLIKLLRILSLLQTMENSVDIEPLEVRRAGNAADASKQMSHVRGNCISSLKLSYSHVLTLVHQENNKDENPVEICQKLYIILENLNSISFLKQFLFIS